MSLRQGEIARQQAHYRKGVVLGLTVAETLLLLLFALLLALGFVLTNRARELTLLTEALAAAQAERQLLQAKVDVLEPLVENRPTDEFFRELVKARQSLADVRRKETELAERERQLARDGTLREALEGSPDARKEARRLAALGARLEREVAKAGRETATDPFEVIPAAVAAADAAAKAGLPPEAAREAFRQAETVARDNATLKGQLVRMRNDLAKVGKGGEDPPCWVTEDGRIQYLLEIDLLGSDRLRVQDVTPAARLADRKALNIPGALFGRDLSRSEFLRLTLPLESYSKARRCRFFVYANDRTGETQKVLFQNLLLTVEGRFYKNLRRTRGGA